MKESSEVPKRKRALVLSGGGARGAYEVGVMKALSQMGVQFDVVYGTSIGAINGVFFAQHRLDRLEQLWRGWRPGYFKRPSLLTYFRMLTGKRWSVFDTKVLERLLKSELDLDRLHESPIEAGFIVTDLCTLDTRLITTRQIHSQALLIDVLMATCALPFLLPPRPIEGSGLWIDGGIVRNTPVLAALKTGATEIYSVVLQSDHPYFCPATISQYLARCVDVVSSASAVNGTELIKQCNQLSAMITSCNPVALKILQPSHPTNVGLFDFAPKISRRLIKEGYKDTCERFAGLSPSFRPNQPQV